MHIECTRHRDAGEPDVDGTYEYHYEYDMYRFTEGVVCFVARSYTDKPDEAHFLRIEVKRHRRCMIDADLAHPLLLEAVVHLRHAGKTQLRWLSGRGNGYQSLPLGPHLAA